MRPTAIRFARLHLPAVLLLTGALAGCASVRPEVALADVRATLDGRTVHRTVWVTGAAEDAEARAAVARLLADSLTAEAAVQVALLNNRHLQATYETLGLAQAQLVQAGLLGNPVFGAGALWPLDGGPPEWRFRVASDFLDVLYRPLRRAVARGQYEAARLRAASAVLELEAETRAAFVRAQADAARLGAQRRVVASAEAGYAASRLLREAGNVPMLDVLAEQALFEEARLGLALAEAQAEESREALVRLMGLSGPDAHVRPAGALPPVPPEAPYLTGDVLDVAALERAAVEASLALGATRADVLAAARAVGLAVPESALPNLSVGAELEGRPGDWEAGPEVGLRLPLFDTGQARRAAARSVLREQQARYEALAVDVRSAARSLAVRLAAARRTALHYQTTVLPLRARLVQETLLQYNAMQVGVFHLLQAQQLEAEAARRYFDALAAYWTARADLGALLAGYAPNLGRGGLVLAPAGGTARLDPH
ncbi:MAG: TolC family protein [Rubricoccaceae bacterium]